MEFAPLPSLRIRETLHDAESCAVGLFRGIRIWRRLGESLNQNEFTSHIVWIVVSFSVQSLDHLFVLTGRRDRS